jgi:hypothetical protein
MVVDPTLASRAVVSLAMLNQASVFIKKIIGTTTNNKTATMTTL